MPLPASLGKEHGFQEINEEKKKEGQVLCNLWLRAGRSPGIVLHTGEEIGTEARAGTDVPTAPPDGRQEMCRGEDNKGHMRTTDPN